MQWTTGNIFRVLGIVTLFIIFLIFMYQILGVLGYLAAAFLITILLSPLVDGIQKRLPRKKRGIAILLTLLIVFGIIVAMCLVIIPPLAKEMSAMIASLSEYASGIKNNPELTKLYETAGVQNVQVSQLNLAGSVKDAMATIGKAIGGLIAGISSGIFVMITIITLTFFMLLDTKKMIRGIGVYVPKKYQDLYLKLNVDLFSIVSKYFSGVIIVAGIAGISSFIPLFFFDAQYALALAMTIAIFDLIPMIGATIGSIVVIIVLLLEGNIPAAAFMTLFLIVYQQIENNVIIPLVQKQTVKMSPLAILVALLIGGAIGGIIGTLLAIPAAAFIKVIYETLKTEGYLKSAPEEA